MTTAQAYQARGVMSHHLAHLDPTNAAIHQGRLLALQVENATGLGEAAAVLEALMVPLFTDDPTAGAALLNAVAVALSPVSTTGELNVHAFARILRFIRV